MLSFLLAIFTIHTAGHASAVPSRELWKQGLTSDRHRAATATCSVLPQLVAALFAKEDVAPIANRKRPAAACPGYPWAP